MIRVLIVDDHPPIRTGLWALLRAEPGINPVAAEGTAADALRCAEHSSIDVAVLDFHLPDMNGITLARRLRKQADPPGLVLYSAYGDERLALAAALAEVTRVLPKSSGADALYAAIRETARGRREAPAPPDPSLLSAAEPYVRVEDLPLLGMACDGTSSADIARVLGIDAPAVEKRLDRILEELVGGIGPLPAVST